MDGGDCSVEALPHTCPWLDGEEPPSVVIDEGHDERPDERAVADNEDVQGPIGTV